MKKLFFVLLLLSTGLVCSAQSIRINPNVRVEVPFSFLSFEVYEESDDAYNADKHSLSGVSITIKCGDAEENLSTGENNKAATNTTFPSLKLLFRFECEGYEPFETTWEQTELCQYLQVFLKKSVLDSVDTQTLHS